MKETQLKKEFKQKDVQRARNLIQKDYTNRTTVGTGYSKRKEKHSEGDIWEEDGRTWTIKNGVKQNITKLDNAKKALQVPLTCPKCNGSMKHRFSKKMYKIHGMCFDCVINMEAKLRRAGLYEEYEKQMILGNLKVWADGLEQWAQSVINESHTYVTEEGDVEDWKGNTSKQNTDLLNTVVEYVEHVKKHLE
jgi:hypothetical protein